MFARVFSAHQGLRTARRLPALVETPAISAVELVALILLGGCAAYASTYLKLGLGIPGHNIIRVVFPMALGLALVPRVGSASIMGLSGMASAAGFVMAGAHNLGFGAATSLALTGFLIDVALIGARPGWSIYLRLALAGWVANLAAFLVKAGGKMWGGLAGDASLEMWLPKAIVTYSVCGLVAGLISAAVWFRARAKEPSDTSPEAPL